MAERSSIICFGDSNTYGAGGFGDIRYPAAERWPDILAEDEVLSSKFEFINMGQNGREIPNDLFKIGAARRKMFDYEPVGLIIVMLGTNDLIKLFRSGMSAVAANMEQFIRGLLQWQQDPSKIMLIAPTHTRFDSYGTAEAEIDDLSLEFAEAYKALAEKYRLHFADAGQWNLELGPDGVHFTENDHITFAQEIKKELIKILPL